MAKKEQLVQNVVDVTHTADVAAVASNPDWAALMQSPYTWITLSTILFLGIFLRYALPPINRALDARSHKIYEQLEQATLLRAQAQELLASYERERESNAKEAEAIIAAAKAEAEALRARAESDLKQALDRRSQQALEKIARAEQEAIAFVRTQMVDAATKATATIVGAQLENSKEDPAIAVALKAIEQQIH
jgi:F-type H+-transporting ATPase subunit b